MTGPASPRTCCRTSSRSSCAAAIRGWPTAAKAPALASRSPRASWTRTAAPIAAESPVAQGPRHAARLLLPARKRQPNDGQAARPCRRRRAGDPALPAGRRWRRTASRWQRPRPAAEAMKRIAGERAGDRRARPRSARRRRQGRDPPGAAVVRRSHRRAVGARARGGEDRGARPRRRRLRQQAVRRRRADGAPARGLAPPRPAAGRDAGLERRRRGDRHGAPSRDARRPARSS